MKTKKLNDEDVLKKLKDMQAKGRTEVSAGEIARIFGVDSVRALGAMERVKHRLRDGQNTEPRSARQGPQDHE